MKTDFLIIGAGLAGATFAQLATSAGYNCIVYERQNDIGGQCKDVNINGINVHRCGPHIFHTSNEKVWKYVNMFSEFNHFVNSPIASSNGKLYNLPFNMNTFYQLFGVKTPEEAMKKLEQERVKFDKPKNLEEQALSLVGRTIYKTLIKGYTEKQWNKSCTELSPDIIKRLPLRFTFDNNYFNDKYQGIPVEGYSEMISKMLKDTDIYNAVKVTKEKIFRDDFDVFHTCHTHHLNYYIPVSNKTRIIYTGSLDEYFNFCFGKLDYRSVRFRTKWKDTSNYQGNAVINYTDKSVPYTRSIEHRHFAEHKDSTFNGTLISYEYSCQSSLTNRCYPINDKRNVELYNRYLELAKKEKNFYPLGRLAEYKYYDMDDVIESAMNLAEQIF